MWVNLTENIVFVGDRLKLNLHFGDSILTQEFQVVALENMFFSFQLKSVNEIDVLNDGQHVFFKRIDDIVTTGFQKWVNY